MSETTLEYSVIRLLEPYPCYLFALGTEEPSARSWTLVNPPPEESGVRRLAIEEDRGGCASPPSAAAEEGLWDRGRAEILSRAAYRIELRLEGKRLKGRYMTFVPTWGRNTEKRLWVLFKIPPPKKKAPQG